MVTMTDTQVIEPQTAFVRYFRKVPTARQYDMAEASVSLPVELPVGGDVNSQEFLAKVAEAMGNAKAEVLTALGIETTVDENGNLVEQTPAPVAPEAAVANAFPGAETVPAPLPDRAPGGGNGGTDCPQCGGPMWDNRAKKASGEWKANSPDYSCKDKQGCGKAVWLTRKGG